VYPDVAKRDILECVGNYSEGMERMFCKDHLGTGTGTDCPDCIFFPSAVIEIKIKFKYII